MTDRKTATKSTSIETRVEGLRDRAADAYDGARDKAIDAYDSARGTAANNIAGAPFAALGAGLAVGALIAALLPKTQVEDRLLGPVTDRVGTAGKAAVDAAKLAGRDKLNELNITREAGKGVVQSLIDGIGEAARSSGQAALGAVRENR